MYITIAELPEYIRHSERLLDEDERKNIIDYLSIHPKAGDIIQGTGGLRKLRWKRERKGKRGGVRVIYYYHNECMPLYLLTMFGKGEKANLNKRKRNELAKMVKRLVSLHLERI